ncbi:MAG TPA: patatin-like phospholipase family protein [Pyrinomonadaceae bacterium]|jgi:predicted acylesterase/phospholipase RssA/ABC-type phosphate/phosphonate transport system substrate-binding protein
MKPALSLSFATAACLALLLPAHAAAQSRATKPTQVVRVGITEYQNVEESYHRYEQLFREFSQAAGNDKPVTFEFAIGNYGEVLDWYNKGAIHVAILSAMPVADLLLNAGPNDLEKIEAAYLGDVSVTKQPFVSAANQSVKELFPPDANEDPFKYRTGGVVLDSDSEIRNIEDVKKFWLKDQVKFLFVRPFSMSGYILPLSVLRSYGIDPKPEQMEFTYQHQKSLEFMRDTPGPVAGARAKHLVAFVLDTTAYEPPPGGRAKLFRRVEGMRELDDYRIPREIVLANYHLEKNELDEAAEGYANEFAKFKAIMSRLLADWRARTGGKRTVMLEEPGGKKTTLDIQWRMRPAGWRNDYSEMEKALNSTKLPRQLLYRSTLDELLGDLANEARRGRPPRLALVLSGGGAKCAYQAGAVVAVEKKLKQINEKLKKDGVELARPIDIDLVVGTSGGAINALLAALGVTGSDKAEAEMRGMWGSFRQRQFFQPPLRFNLIFGLCFGLLQALLITVAVLLFGRHSMNWPVTFIVLLFFAAAQLAAATYFQTPPGQIWWLLGIEAVFVFSIILTVLLFGFLIDLVRGRFGRKAPVAADDALHHWRRLTIVLMIFAGLLEGVVAKTNWVEGLVSPAGNNHWVEHGWMLLTLVCNWAFPYPLLVGLLMALVGRTFWRGFDWNRRREAFVWWTAIVLLVFSGLLVSDVFFKQNSPSEAQGIEDAFAQMIPALIHNTVRPEFAPPPKADVRETPLANISRGLLEVDPPLLRRDLVITTSRLPQTDEGASGVRTLPDDLYFYFRYNKDERLKPPLDRRFVPFKWNREKLLEVVIGSSTIYPIFPSRTLENVRLGNEEVPQHEPVEKMKVIDGGFIHNIPIEAAGLWKASHIILIDASPPPGQSEPLDFFDNVVTAFGYLFDQAQRTDMLARGGAETFELRPTSGCDKENFRPTCTGDAGVPEPDMDTFDFAPHLVEEAFDLGLRDALGLKDVKDVREAMDTRDAEGTKKGTTIRRPLFVRVPGPPLFRTLTANTPAKAPTPVSARSVRAQVNSGRRD